MMKSLYDKELKKIKDFWAGNIPYICSLNTSKFAYRQLFDINKILDLLTKHFDEQTKLPGCNIPSLFPDFGTISTAEYWGGETFFPDDDSSDIFIKPLVETINEALNLSPLPVDTLNMAATKAIELFSKAKKKLGNDNLWLRTPDMQGPLNVAAQIMNQEEMLMAMYTDKEELTQFLAKVTDFIINYAKYLIKKTNGKICGNIWPYTFFPVELGLSITEDIMPLISPDNYLEFGIPLLEKLSDIFAGLHIHCCGEWGRHAKNLSESSTNIRAMEFHYPFTKIEDLECLYASGTVLIPYISLDKQEEFKTVTQYYEHLLESAPKAHFWFAFPSETDEVINFINKYDNI